MKKLLYISPFWPVKSGISEYSESLIWGLEKYFEITILVNGYKLENKKITKHFPIINYESEMVLAGYDVLLYNFGNNPDAHEFMYELMDKYPGYVIMHDVSLFYLTVDYYAKKGILYQKVYEMEGAKGIRYIKDSLKQNPEPNLLLHKDLAANVRMNAEVLRKAKGVFVHSEYAAGQIENVIAKEKICKINLVENKIETELKKDFLKKRFGIKNSEKIIGAAGFIAPSKQNEISCQAVKEYNCTHKEKIHYVMIGEGDYVDSYLDEYIHKTGFLDNEDFYDALSSCDVILNLRYPYNGESSATLIQSMSIGKPCIVTDIGWFSELPNDSIKKVKKDIKAKHLAEIIEGLVMDSQSISRKGCDFVKEQCAAENIAKVVKKFVAKVERW
ncbi:MAG: glycosyltransferase family 4 protein [Lachnospiraceae bacterium]|nr:glycosyltransferase family 4 protein [Lachnospiraceae bacterium]MBO5176761.1 glycosyltransferase family 4 protein [Lachnospiraceae bacterium]